ncbi:PREDICTED: uncharacterized protein LOC104711805 [Camelina sativa]|uniref:Uncharacterized protein LOC104711805 n=1 Tax=Camelina sativa TaxID=90675 RepID=A0ABM0TIG3_CAMSA|nr:PREDICTED: uncharacterized protein LOC104711805 [Camelina sativa]XP_010426884.1 PREDICTED: uncharacterized protein LOC104711805 [Camelina sativa]
MRIRKNTKLASVLLGYGGERPETYVCHLNQSPWDVIPVTSSGDCELTNLLDSSWFLPLSSSSSSSSTPPPLIHHHQFDGEDNNFNADVSLGDCNGAAVRFNNSMGDSHNLVSVEKLNLNAAEDKYELELSPDADEPMDQSDSSSDKKSEDLLEPKSPPVSDEGQADVVTIPAPPKRGRPRGTGKKALASAAASKNPYEFYYYSGFGPRWGRKRGGSDDEKLGLGDNNKRSRSSTSSSSNEEGDKTAAFGSGSVSFDGFDYVEEDYVDVMDEDDESDHGKKKKKDKMIMMKKTIKRGRKPVKERSLKSLM